MKKLLALLLAALLLLCYGCGNTDGLQTVPDIPILNDQTGYKVTNPLPYPDYTFEGEPTTQQLRETAVRAMRDLLSVRWSTAESIAYRKNGPVSDKYFQHQADTTYAGTLYSSSNTGLFQFLEFYDHETGRLFFPEEYGNIDDHIGTSCADCVIWSLNTVCTSLTGNYYPVTMVYQNGYYPVGDYTYDFTITSYNKQPTYTIIKENGQEVILDAYTKMQPGDALVSTSDDHAMMVIEPVVVKKTSSGQLDTEASYVMIQDQRGGRGAGFYEQEENGETILYSGRTSAKFTFAELLKKNYIPVAPAEFLEEKSYEAATVTATKANCRSLEELLEVQIASNYPLAVVNVILKDKQGGQYILGRELFSGAKRGGVPKSIVLKDLEALADFDGSEYSRNITIQIEVVTSTGERFIPVTSRL